MGRWSLVVLLLVCGALFSATGCQFLLDFDRDRIPVVETGMMDAGLEDGGSGDANGVDGPADGG